MSSLSQVKAEVKAWERAFKSQHGRDPSKDDIKADAGGIAAKYSLYRQLSKKSQDTVGPSSQKEPRRPSKDNALKRSASKAELTSLDDDRAGPSSLPSTTAFRTPTKSKPRHEGPSGFPLRNPFLSSPSTPRRSTTSGYSSEIVDPNPQNAFARASPSFVYASSPARLKSLLEANSLQKQSPTKEITPRTRARKRLRGEEVDDTPGKPVIANRMGYGARKSSGHLGASEGEMSDGGGRRRREYGMSEESSDADMDDGLELEGDIVGPTPTKPSSSKKFVSLFDKEIRAEASFRSGGGEMDTSPAKGLSLFTKGKERDDERMEGARRNSSAWDDAAVGRMAAGVSSVGSDTIELNSNILAEGSPSNGDNDLSQLDGDEPMDRVGEEFEPAEAMGEEANLSVTSSPPPTVDNTLARVLELSSSESDHSQDDGEDHRFRRVHKIRIEPYRLSAQERAAKQHRQKLTSAQERLSETFEGANEQGHGSPEARTRVGERSGVSPAAGASSTSGNSFAELSLLSPSAKTLRKTEALQENRAKAIFDATAAAKLKAARRAPVWLPGESADGADGDSSSEKPPEADFDADDDWESDPEGWKATGLPNDDDW